MALRDSGVVCFAACYARSIDKLSDALRANSDAGQQDRSLDFGPEEAAGSRRRAVGTTGSFQGLRADKEQRTQPSTPQGPQYLSRNYGPDGSAGLLCQSTPLKADDLTSSGSWPTRQSNTLDFEPSFYTLIDLQGSGQVVNDR